jgi:hypothetical protein
MGISFLFHSQFQFQDQLLEISFYLLRMGGKLNVKKIRLQCANYGNINFFRLSCILMEINQRLLCCGVDARDCLEILDFRCFPGTY